MKARYQIKAEEIKEYQRQYRKENQEKITNNRRPYQRNIYLTKRVVRRLAFILRAGGKCVECDNSNVRVLQFHHRDKEDKGFEIGRALNSGAQMKYPYEVMIKELEKCDLLCGNCHAERHNSWTDDELQMMLQLSQEYFNAVQVKSDKPIAA